MVPVWPLQILLWLFPPWPLPVAIPGLASTFKKKVREEQILEGVPSVHEKKNVHPNVPLKRTTELGNHDLQVARSHVCSLDYHQAENGGQIIRVAIPCATTTCFSFHSELKKPWKNREENRNIQDNVGCSKIDSPPHVCQSAKKSQ